MYHQQKGKERIGNVECVWMEMGANEPMSGIRNKGLNKKKNERMKNFYNAAILIYSYEKVVEKTMRYNVTALIIISFFLFQNARS